MSAPAWATPRNPDRPSLGPRIAWVSKHVLGTDLMPWQSLVLDTACEIDPATGGPAFGTVVVTVPRQSGKTALTRALAVGRSLMLAPHSTWYSAQSRQAARDRFDDLRRGIAAGPLRGRTKITLSNGHEGIEFHNGSSFRIFAPKEDAVHGDTIDAAVIDEAWVHDEARGSSIMQAVVPAGATRPWFQLWIVSTAGTADSTWLRRFVEAGRNLPPTGIAHFEWSAPSSDLADVIAAHPARGWTISDRAITDAHATLPPGEFGRAFGNRWTSAAEAVIPAGAWDAVRTEQDPPHAPPAAVAVDVSPDRSTAAVAVAWWTPSGVPAVAVAEHGPRTAQLPATCADLARRFAAPVVLDPRSAAATVGDDLARSGTRLRTMTGGDIAVASQQLYDAVVAGGVAVTSDKALDAAVAAAATRPVGDGWAWGRRKAAGDITPLCAATWALWALTHPPAEPMLLM